MNKSNVIGIDLAKNVIQVCKIDRYGELKLNRSLSPSKLIQFLSNSEPSIVGLEGCGSCHYWARLAKSYGHDVRIINPKKVKAFLQGHKTDANDALAIAIAATQPGMVFGQMKGLEQQILQTLETSRKLLDKELTSLGNHIRAFLYEYGISTKKGKKSLREAIPIILDDINTQLPSPLKPTLRILWDRYIQTQEQLKESLKQISALVKQLDPCKRLMTIEGVGVVCASLLYACIGNGKEFKNGRQASVYIGLTPKQHSSGGKTFIKGIDKYGGNIPLRSALYQGALAVILRLPNQPRTEKERWLKNLLHRVGLKRACIALANKTVRTAWALLNNGTSNKPVFINI